MKVAGWTALSLVVLLVVAFFLLNSRFVQQKLMHAATDMLSERLQTSVTIDSVSIGILSQDVRLHGLNVADRQRRPMLHADLLSANVGIIPLLKKEVKISKASVSGVKALLCKNDSDSVANYQFVIDAFSKKSEPDTSSKKLSVDINKLTFNDIDIQYNDNSIALGHLKTSIKDGKVKNAEAKQLSAKWTQVKSDSVTISHGVSIDRLDLKGKDDLLTLTVNGIHYTSDNHRPRKNTGKPKRGFFDPGHFDVTSNLVAEIDHIDSDSIRAALKQFTARDSVSGIDVREFHCNVGANRRNVFLSDVMLRQTDTWVKFDKGIINLPNKNDSTHISYQTSTITGNAILRDISRPFAPILNKFSIPLSLSVVVNGTDEQISFSNVVVNTADKQLIVTANGNVEGLKLNKQHLLKVHFNVGKMSTNTATTKKILSQFPINVMMKKQISGLGTINYTGSFDVLWKKLLFQGRLATQAGSINFNFTLDQLNKYLTGAAKTANLNAGRVLDMPNIGKAAFSANFKIDISGQRNAQMRRQSAGKLPIGTLTAHIDQAAYKNLSVGNLDISIKSNGALAEGELTAPRKFLDLNCSFTFTDTDNLRHLNVKPRLKFNLFNREKIDND